MRFLPDERGQSIQIGAVLLFAVLIILLALWQAIVVPNQNEEIEFNHNEDLQQQMTELRSTANSMPDARTTRSVTLELGVRYPSRSIFRNPPPARGTIRTVGGPDGELTATIHNASALDREGATGAFWDGTDRRYGTKSIQYRPGYNEYSNPPRTIYEHSVLFNEFDTEGQDLALSDQTLVQGTRLTLVTVNGSLSESRVDSASLDLEPLSTETETVEVEPDGGPITLELPTRLSQGEWRELFEDVETVDTSDVTVDDSAFPDSDLGMLRITLAETDESGNTRTYDLRLAKIGVGTETTTTTPAYVTDIAGDGSVIQSGQTQTLRVQARDRFNRPMSGVSVTASAEGGTFAGGSDTTSTTTGTDGEATLQYTGTAVDTNAINVSIEEGYQPVAGEDHNASTPTNLTMQVTVEGGGSDNTGNSAYSVDWRSPTVDNPSGSLSACTESDCTWDVDADSDNVLTLRSGTTPAIDGANIDFAIDNGTVGSVFPGEETTGPSGEVTTDLTAEENGTIGVYVGSGGSSDVINITVENVTAGATGSAFPRVVYLDGGTLRGLDGDGNTEGYVTDPAGIAALGQANVEFDGDSFREVPFVNGNDNLRVVDTDGNIETLDDSGDLDGTRLGIGDWDDDGTQEIVYVRGGNLYSVDPTGTVQHLCSDRNPSGNCRGGGRYGSAAVAGIGDFDTDGENEIVYVNDNDEIAYFSQEDNPATTVTAVDNTNAVSEPADFDGDGDLEVAYVNGNDNLTLADSAGTDGTLSTGYDVTTSPMSSLDWTGDGTPDIIHVNSNTGTLYYYDAVSDAASEITDSNGNTISPATDPGVG